MKPPPRCGRATLAAPAPQKSLFTLSLLSLLFLGGACGDGNNDDDSSSSSSQEETSTKTPFTKQVYNAYDWDGGEVTITFNNDEAVLTNDDGYLAAYSYDYVDAEDGSVTLKVSQFAGWPDSEKAMVNIATGLKAGTDIEDVLADTTTYSDLKRTLKYDEAGYKKYWGDVENKLDNLVAEAETVLKSGGKGKYFNNTTTGNEEVDSTIFEFIKSQVQYLKATYGADELFGGDGVTFNIDTTSKSAIKNGDFTLAEGTFRLTPLGKFEVDTSGETSGATKLAKGTSYTLSEGGDLKSAALTGKKASDVITLGVEVSPALPTSGATVTYEWSLIKDDETAVDGELDDETIAAPKLTLTVPASASGSNKYITPVVLLRVIDSDGKLFAGKYTFTNTVTD